MQELDPTLTAKVEDVCAAVTAAEGLPQGLLAGIATAAKTCLSTPSASRHESQTWVVTLVGQTLQEVLAKKMAEATSLRAKVEEATSKKAELDATCNAAASSVEEQAGVEVVAREAFESAASQAATTLETVSNEEATLQKEEDRFSKNEAKRSSLESAMDCFLELQAGENRAKAKAIKTLMKVGKDCAFDSQLLVAAPASLEKDSGDRGGFDGLVFDQLETHLKNAMVEVADELARGVPGRSLQQAAVEGAKAQRDLACENEVACRQRWEAAKKALKSADVERRTAEKAVKSCSKEVAEAVAALSHTGEQVEACEKTLSLFKELEALPVPEPPTPWAPPQEQVLGSVTEGTEKQLAADTADQPEEAESNVVADKETVTEGAENQCTAATTDKPEDVDSNVLVSKVEDSSRSEALLTGSEVGGA